MKRSFLALAFACGATAGFPASTPIPGLQSMQIEARVLPVFPAGLIARGMTTGTARVVIKVDASGRLDDWLVVAYSHEAFAKTAVDSMQRWRFQPARLNGEPVTAQSELHFAFRAEGVVISQNMVEHFLSRERRGHDPELVYRPSTLRELDRIPTPVHVVSPVYTAEMAQRGVRGEVTVEFFIDENGQVRLPVAPGVQPDELSELATEAVAQWKFEPPTRRGRPVLVQARQRFQFTGAGPGAGSG